MVSGMEGYQWKRVQGIRNRTRASDVVEMGMRIPEMSNAPTAFLRFGQDEMTVPGRVDDGCFFGFRIGH
jgi:hypothetical protein